MEQQRLRNLLASVSSDSEDDEAAGTDDNFLDDDEHFEERSDHNSESEQEVDEILEQYSDAKLKSHSLYYLGKDKITKWYKKKVKTSICTRSSNIVIHLPGAKGSAKSSKTPINFFKLLISDDIIEDVVKSTNIYINKIQSTFYRERDCKVTNATEINALFGLLVLAGLFKSSHRKLSDLWNISCLGIDIFHKQ
ncbi:hypothetical protein AVEN_234785-1 [Araneus ventricosus]|uniref:PiggyBac transposable element-derived protein domain-containing protein n=1 Tax=Araneus ventricosus TaxID=182803 RepID=A0A4Y2F9W3_ARAVE|nr:hypothetical protein AVEN_234785-1 [Araneus ventricosus]